MAAVCIVLIINIAILGWVVQKDHEDGITVIYEGSNKDAGTVCVTGARNLFRIDIWRGILSVCLALSSVPLSLFYNSVVFTSPAAADYLAVLVSPEFLDGGAYCAKPNGDNGWDHNTSLIETLQSNHNSLGHMNTAECRKAYDVPVQSGWSHVLLVSDYHSPNDTVIYTFWQSTAQGQPASPGWIVGDSDDWAFEEPLCNGTFTYDWNALGGGGMPETCTSDTTYDPSNSLQRRQFPDDTLNTTATTPTSSSTESPSTTKFSGGFWTPPAASSTWPAGRAQVDVQYCLALASPNLASEVNISITFPAVVIAFNIVKLLCLLGTLLLPRFDPLATIGDAIASFLGAADLHTEHQGLLNHRQVTSREWRKHSANPGPTKPRKWLQPPLMLCRTVSPGKWLLNLSIIVVVFVGGLAMLYVGFHWGKWDAGF
ncbi:hypothetical protein LTR78_005836 [Recurvomyces mirabilis]|uniref:DUF6536 domain-containing protein n=1 Tax=Recurvomyces mirabilis TaxID=574656 RepID=A0AAE1C160_9PEZI|nr:hypothetical protein LTR78_005836 [Recurvomyces mirabilis]KAK5154216.1 hypothetical protein LTS14_006901 [Recurvomyces mirabilis]